MNSPTLLANRDVEIVPLQAPLGRYVNVDLQDALVTALKNRPEIDEAMQEIQAAGVRLDMAQNELLPVLDLVLETYVTGLQGGFDIGQSFTDQFSVGEPGYTAGFVFEVPLHNRAASARLSRRRLELRQLSSQLQSTTEILKAEVEVAVREVNTAYGEMQGKYQAMSAAADDVDYLQRRWELLPGEDRAASFLLADLLDAQDRLMSEEFDFARSRFDYTLSLARLNKATGTLLQQEQIVPHQVDLHGLPEMMFDKATPSQRP
ncbi:MAG TPA: TolC family protein [Woeseiaceae bacterium]